MKILSCVARICLMFGVVSSAGIVLNNNGYENVFGAIADSIAEDTNLIDNIKMTSPVTQKVAEAQHHVEVSVQSESIYYSSEHAKTFIQRTAPLSLGTDKSFSKSVEQKKSFSKSIKKKTASMTPANVTDVKNTTQKEKHDMKELNDRFEGYIGEVRFLKAQNYELASNLKTMQSKWRIETTEIKHTYGIQSKKDKTKIAKLNEKKFEWRTKYRAMEEELNDYKSNREQEHTDYESKMARLRSEISFLGKERTRDKEPIKKLKDDFHKARVDLDKETLLRVVAENEKQTLVEEFAFLNTIHKQELKELDVLAYRDSTAENREYWKSELAVAIRDIQTDYEEEVTRVTARLEVQYKLKMSQVNTSKSRQNLEMSHYKEETQKLRSQLPQLRSRISDLESTCSNLKKEYDIQLNEYKDNKHQWELKETKLITAYNEKIYEFETANEHMHELFDAKLSLEKEINSYRKLLSDGNGSLGSVIERWRKEANHKLLDTYTSSADIGQLQSEPTYTRSDIESDSDSVSDSDSDSKSVTPPEN